MNVRLSLHGSRKALSGPNLLLALSRYFAAVARIWLTILQSSIRINRSLRALKLFWLSVAMHGKSDSSPTHFAIFQLQSPNRHRRR